MAGAERQFNIVHDYLVERLRQMRAMVGDTVLHFASEKHILEEHVQMEYLREIAEEAGFRETDHLDMGEIGLDRSGREPRLVDLAGREIRFLYKMYPWEWLMREEIGRYLPALNERVGFIEPLWKVILSSKALLPVLWDLFPGHRLLLPAYFEPTPMLGNSYAIKPVVGWEGKGVQIVRDGVLIASNDAGPFGDEPLVYQALADLEMVPGLYAQIGSWVVDERAAGILVREDSTPLIRTASRVVPHYWEP
jgi:glutathionylspermidine synthase